MILGSQDIPTKMLVTNAEKKGTTNISISGLVSMLLDWKVAADIVCKDSQQRMYNLSLIKILLSA